jgi:hypothetical protein
MCFFKSKLAMICFKYQVYLYGSEVITYLNVFLWVVTEPSPESETAPTPPLQAALPPLSITAEPSLIGKITLVYCS